jgi:hypothetical protein
MRFASFLLRLGLLFFFCFALLCLALLCLALLCFALLALICFALLQAADTTGEHGLHQFAFRFCGVQALIPAKGVDRWMCLINLINNQLSISAYCCVVF